MSSPTTSVSPNSNGDGQPDQTTHNTLRKDPPSRNQPVPAHPVGNKSKLVKHRASAADNEPLVDLTTNPQQQPASASVSRTNRLRKALGVGASTPSDSSQTNGDSTPRHAPGSRRPSERRSSPSTSPSTSKRALPPSSESSQQHPPPPRPGAPRTQSYSKRHASFDTPREVPMPAMPLGSSAIDPIALDDADMDRNEAAAAGWASRHTDSSRRPTAEPLPSFRKVSTPPLPQGSADNAKRGGMHIDLGPTQPPQIARNNSAPTPPHTPAAERVDLRYPYNNDKITPDSGTSSVQSGSGSEHYMAHANNFGEAESYLEAGELGLDSYVESSEGKTIDLRGRMDAIFKEGRLSTASLPLPRSYGAERVSRLPAPAKPTGKAPSSSSGSDGGQQSTTPTGLVKVPDPRRQRGETLKASLRDPSSSVSAATYRTSYPFAGSFPRDVPLVPRQSSSSFVADVEKSAQPGTAWRSSGPFMRRDYSEDDSEEKSAISQGQFPKQPEIEAPQVPSHPFLSAPSLITPTLVTTARTYFTPSSTTATPGHERTSPGVPTVVPSSDAVTATSISPAPSTTRTSTASGSSGASSNPAVSPGSLISELERQTPSSLVQPSQQRQTTSTLGDAVSRSRVTAEQAQVDAGPTMTVDTTPSAYILEANLPGYQRDEITLSTRKKRILHVVADGFVSGGGHFERRVSFGYDADMSRVRAEFNGSTLRITVPRRPTPQTFATSLGASATVGGGSSSGIGGTGMFWRGRSNVL